MMTETVCEMDLYIVPSDEIRNNRKAFYDLRRERSELIKTWLNRIELSVSCCEFAKYTEFLLIDKFFCGLHNDEMHVITRAHTWSFKQFNKHFNPTNNTGHGHMNANMTLDENADQSHTISVNAVKCEPVSSVHCCFAKMFDIFT